MSNRVARMGLLNKLNKWETGECNGCSKMDASEPFPRCCDGCPIYTEIKGIGYELDRLMQVERQERLAVKMSFRMDVEEYVALVKQGMLDKEIIQLKKTSVKYFYRWKKEAGLLDTLGSSLDNAVERRDEIKHKIDEQNSKTVKKKGKPATAPTKAPKQATAKRGLQDTMPAQAKEELALRKHIDELQQENMNNIIKYESEINDLQQRLQQANSANATLAFDIVNVQNELESLRDSTSDDMLSKHIEAENEMLKEEILSLQDKLRKHEKFPVLSGKSQDVGELQEHIARLSHALSQTTERLHDAEKRSLHDSKFIAHLLDRLTTEHNLTLQLQEEREVKELAL